MRAEAPGRDANGTERVPQSLDVGRPVAAEADVEINAVHYSWAQEEGAALSPLAPLLIHELGHVLGLAHSCAGLECASHEAARALVMYPDPREGTPRVRPTEEDCEALATLYPARAPLVFLGRRGGSCALRARRDHCPRPRPKAETEA